MQAVIYSEYGTPDVLQLKDVDKPTPKDNEVLIKVHAASLNASDLEALKGSPVYIRMWGLFKPKYKILGSDIAGQVEAVGKNVVHFQPGDAVFGDILGSWGGFAEHVCAPENALTRKPESVTFEQAAAIPQAATVALQGLRDKGKIQPGQKVLINGAGGGAGSFALQFAKIFGAHVTGVDNTTKLKMMRTLGADKVIDYTQEDFTQNGESYDLILDFVASHSIFDYKRALSPGGKYVMVGGFMRHIFQTLITGSLISLTGSKKMGILAAKPNNDMPYILELIESGKLTPVIEKVYPLRETPAAFRHLDSGKAQGKLVISLENVDKS
ncbi:MAG: NAD(P)-dependent alcohol dehydrogenase [Calditrichaeota bacterium]|nr:MAG: NAD(P)-dependent alcohol dehydrogenase [Calditrichota bacterium]